MLHSTMVAATERRWTEADLLEIESESKLRWGGMHILWMGDMLQLPPPSRFVRPLYYDCVTETRGGDEFDEDGDRLDGVRLFREFVKMELSTQNRARGDRAHAQRIHRMRTSAQPIDDDLLDSLKPLCAEDMKDAKWHFAPIVVTSNIERHLINKTQVFRFAHAKGLPVLTWVDPLVNAPMEVDEQTNEKMDPTARRYFVLGAPCYIVENLNSAATGIVNGTPGYLHSLSWDDGVSKEGLGSFAPVPGHLVEVPPPHTINVLCKQGGVDPVPMIAKRSTSEQGDATLARLKHSVELGFSVTFHKIQGQTVDRIILALHPRKSCQLLSMSFEMLYVAMTRVRHASDIRILYSSAAGLKHLRQLKRPVCFDAWVAAYDNSGRWDAAELKRQAASDKEKAMSILRESRPFSSYTIKLMHGILKSLGMKVPNAPGKNYPRKSQYRDALYPVWVQAKVSRANHQRKTSVSSRTPVKGVTGTRKMSRSCTPTVKRRRPQPVTPQPGNGQSTVTPEMAKRRRRGNLTRRNLVPVAYAELVTFHPQEQCIIASARRTLRMLRRNSSCDADLSTRAWARDVPEVGCISRRTACSWSHPGLMLNDTAVYSIAVHLTRGSVCDVVDPLLVAHPNLLEVRSRLAINWLNTLQAGRVLALTFNDPGEHWWMVFVRLDPDGKTVKLTYRNSIAHWDNQADESVRRTITLLKQLIQSPEYNTNKVGPFEYKQVVPSVSTPRQVQSNSCGIHCCAHILLAARCQIFENPRTFDTKFIDNIRDQALLYYHSYRVQVCRTIVINVEGEQMQQLRNSSRKRDLIKATEVIERKRSRGDVTVGKLRNYNPRKARFLDLTVRDNYADAIEKEAKTIEGRPNVEKYSWVQAGDVIRFRRSGKSRGRGKKCCVGKLVENVWEYDSWLQMFEGQTLQACLPNCKSPTEGDRIYNSFHRDYKRLSHQYGVVAFKLAPWQSNLDRD